MDVGFKRVVSQKGKKQQNSKNKKKNKKKYSENLSERKITQEKNLFHGGKSQKVQ